MAEEKNFRIPYMEKISVGDSDRRCDMEEKLMKEVPISREKLKDLALNHVLTVNYRVCIWKCILEITGVYVESFDFVQKQRVLQYEEALRSLKALQIENTRTDVPNARLFVLMFLMSERRLYFQADKQVKEPINQRRLILAEKIISIGDYHVDNYWISKSLWNIFEIYGKELKAAAEEGVNLIRNENPEFYEDLKKLGAFEESFLMNYFESAFCGVLSDEAAEMVLDKLVCGVRGFGLMSHLFNQLVKQTKKDLKSAKSLENVEDSFKRIGDFSAIVVVAMEDWRNSRLKSSSSSPRDLP